MSFVIKSGYMGEAQWPNGQCERSGFEPCLGTLCCVLGQDKGPDVLGKFVFILRKNLSPVAVDKCNR